MISELKIEAQAQLNLFKLKYTHGGRPRKMSQERVDIIQYICDDTDISPPEADMYFEKVTKDDHLLHGFFLKFLEWFH